MSDMLRITGMVSGMDTDATVKKLIEAEQVKVDRVEQEKQFLEWQKEDYREIANILRGFQDEYFDLINSDTNMRSATTFNMFSGAATIDGVESSAVSIVTSGLSTVDSFTIKDVTALATKDTYKSSSEVLTNIISEAMGDITTVGASEMSFTLDGVTKTINLDGGYGDYADFTTDISTKLQEAFQNVDIIVNESGGKLEFNVFKNGTEDILVDPYTPGTGIPEDGHTLVVNTANVTLGLTAGQSNAVNTAKTLFEVFKIEGASEMTINGVDFSFEDDTKISDMMSEINSSSAGVTISYDNFSDTFSLESNAVGSDDTIDFKNTEGVNNPGILESKFKLDAAGYTAATNAEFTVNDVVTTRSSNTFEINGSSVTLNEIPTGTITVGVTADTTAVKDLIVKFVDSYNELIEKVNDLIDTRKNYDYKPLTAEQKEGMTDDDIEKWDIEARKGTLQGDSALSSLTSSLRSVFYESIDGVGISMYEIGITTSSDYSAKGKLIIDEDKLDKALTERPNEIIELFTKESEIAYSSFTDKATRNSENGLSARIFDVLQDNIRITRDTNGSRGYLIDKAGVETGIDTTSEMAKKILDMDDKINDLLIMLGEKEDNYYLEFGRMESAMATLSSQSDFLASQFGG